MALQSYKPYARFVTLISGIIIIIAGLDASQVINLFPEYANQINTILMIAGILAPAISQELREVRVEDLVKEDIEEPSMDEDLSDFDEDIDDELDDELDDEIEDENIHIHIVVDGDDILEKMENDEKIKSDDDGGA